MHERPQSSQPRRTEPNRLAAESSPYLQQHAFNPVDWFPWGAEALEISRRLDRPIFLSIGYSACHWCHVMEHESFENSEIAKRMNDGFVCIKVDREERPDLDQIYMSAVQMMTGRGGWPMSVFLTPDLRPFFGGTYWPPFAGRGMPGFADILNGVRDAWDNRRGDVTRGAEELTDAIRKSANEMPARSGLSPETLRGAMQQLLRSADRSQGGFGGAPKFPHPMDLRVLLRSWRRFGDAEALDAARLTLDKMAAGGIYDHLGGGFHRYATDGHWLVPHFEKMLYDNALLVPAYLEMFQITGDERYSRVARETLDYVLREMTQPGGGFFSTQDADSEGHEGKFFVWSEDEVLALLGPDDGRLFCYAYDVSPRGNWEGQNILNRPKTTEQAARVLGVSPESLEAVLARGRATLFAARSQRIAPGRDDKVLVSWNGLMISAMSQAANVLGDSRYALAARAAAEFILHSIRDDDGRLLHSFKDGQARFNGYLDDYACLIDGLVDLFQATFEPFWLEDALSLAEDMLSRFEDPRGGGFFFTSIDHEQLVARVKDTQDNATPSGNGMAAHALARLSALTGRTELLGKAYATLEAMSGQLTKFALASGQSLMALDFVLGPSQEIVLVAGDSGQSEVRAMLTDLSRWFQPNKVIAILPPGLEDSGLPPSTKTLLAGKQSVNNQPTVYVCEHGSCQTPLVGRNAWQAFVESHSRTAESTRCPLT